MIAAWLFVTSAAVPLYVYAGYPALIWLIARIRPRPVAQADVLPSMTIVIAAHNEEGVIAAKVANSLGLDYPAGRLEVLICSDGSTDRTEEIVRAVDDPRLFLLALPRAGKAAALNAGAARARGEILVLTDANVELAPDALRKLARGFADPGVGGVSGRKKAFVRHGADTTEVGENLYWRYDQWQKRQESAAGSIIAADGTLYALRRSLYVPIADPAQADDIAISARVVLQGKRLVFDPEAVAWEEAPAEGADEFRRKVRVTNHSLRALFKLGLPLWTSGLYSFELISHKLVRHLVPFFLVLLLLSSGWLAREARLFRFVIVLQLVFYALALAGALLRHRRSGSLKMFSVPYYFCLVNAAALLGVLALLRGTRVREWSPRGS